jgi:hypothetical protein
MATVNLGRVKPVNKGTWSSATTYAIDDFVQYTDNGVLSTYIAVAASTNETPSTSGTENGTYWKYMSKGTNISVGNNQIMATDSSGNPVGLAMGAAGQVVKVNASANGFEFGTGFDGTYKLHYFEKYTHNTQVDFGSVSGSSGDNEKDCLLINAGNYLTITPAHADDLFEFKLGVSYYLPNNSAYGGVGFQSSTTTNFTANRNSFFLSGQHSMGSGSGGFDHYQFHWTNYSGTCSQLGLTAGTTYYVRAIGQKHSTTNNLRFNGTHGTGTGDNHYCSVNHWKKN